MHSLWLSRALKEFETLMCSRQLSHRWVFKELPNLIKFYCSRSVLEFQVSLTFELSNCDSHALLTILVTRAFSKSLPYVLSNFHYNRSGEFQISPLFGLYLQHALIDSRTLFLTLLLSFSWYSHSSNESLGPCMNIICIYRSKKRTPNMGAHLTIDIHRINNALKLIFCGVLAEWPHEVPQFFGCDEATVVLVKMLKSVEIFCVRISRIDSDYERFEI